jgi:hypothetical protein
MLLEELRDTIRRCARGDIPYNFTRNDYADVSCTVPSTAEQVTIMAQHIQWPMSMLHTRCLRTTKV